MLNQTDLSSYLQDLEKLVSIESPTNHVAGIKEIIAYLKNKISPLNLQISEELYDEEAGPCLLISNLAKNSTEKLDVLLLAHMDTVYKVGTYKERGFKVSNNKAYAPGVIDNKAGVLAGIYALPHIVNKGINFAFLINSNEEEGSRNNSKLIAELAKKSKYCLVLEPARADGSLVDARSGRVIYTIKPMNQKDGADNLVNICNIVTFLNKYNNNKGHNTLNFRIIKNNDEHKYLSTKDISLELVVRFRHKSFLKSLERIFTYDNDYSPFKNKVTVEQLIYYPALYPDYENKKLKYFVENLGKKENIKITWQHSMGLSDGCFAFDAGCPTIDGLGPIGGEFHNEKEYLELTSIIPRCNLLINIISNIKKLR